MHEMQPGTISGIKGYNMITMAPKRIFIADDSVFFRTKLSDIFVEAGHNVRFAKDGREVINEIRIDPSSIDLLILDLQMPDIDGFGVLKWIKENGFDGKFPVLAVTGVYETGEVMERVKGLGASGLMTKGFTPEQIIFRVNRILYPEKETEGHLRIRVPVSIPVDFTVGDVTRTGFILNISETGAFIHTKVEFLAGTVMRMKFALPGGDKVMHVKGIVKWTTGTHASKTLFNGSGVMFNSIDEEDAREIRRFIGAEMRRIGAEERDG